MTTPDLDAIKSMLENGRGGPVFQKYARTLLAEVERLDRAEFHARQEAGIFEQAHKTALARAEAAEAELGRLRTKIIAMDISKQLFESGVAPWSANDEDQP